MESLKFCQWVVFGSSSHELGGGFTGDDNSRKFRLRISNEANTIPNHMKF